MAVILPPRFTDIGNLSLFAGFSPRVWEANQRRH